jgi:hypothetical protein
MVNVPGCTDPMQYAPALSVSADLPAFSSSTRAPPITAFVVLSRTVPQIVKVAGGGGAVTVTCALPVTL